MGFERSRKEIAAQFNYDSAAIVADARKRQKGRAKKVVSFAGRHKKRTA